MRTTHRFKNFGLLGYKEKKNAKRLWPVPATLAVMALAAFLAFGLMATTGAQPAAAQSAEPDVKIDPTRIPP